MTIFNISKILTFSLLAFAVSAVARSSAANFRDLNIRLDALPEARVFAGEVNGIHIVGADVGPKDGVPFVLINGYGTSFPYLTLFARKLAANGFRVFVYNPPGQGRNELLSGRQTDERLFGLDGMLSAAEAMVTYAYGTCGHKKVILAGHSLGGVQARLAAIGLTDTQSGGSTISTARFRYLRRRIALIVPMMSPPLLAVDKAIAEKKVHINMLSTYLPAFLKPYQWAQSRFTRLFDLIEDHGLTTYLVKNQDESPWSGLFGAPNLDVENFRQTVEYVGFSHLRFSTQINEDFKRWREKGTVDTHDGLDLAAAWMRNQRGPERIPTLYILGARDSFVPLALAKAEARKTDARVFTVNTGHLGAFFDATAT